MKQNINRFILVKYIGKIFKWFMLIAIPVSAALYIYVTLEGKEYDSLTDAEIRRIIPFAAKEILSHYPFFEAVAKVVNKSLTSKAFSFQKLVDGVIEGLITFGLIDIGKRVFNVSNQSATIEKKWKRTFRLIVLYCFWVILFAYIAGLATDYGFRYLKTHITYQLDWYTTKLILLIAFFIISVVKFAFTTGERLRLCIAWVAMDKIVFTIVTSLCLTFFSYWIYNSVMLLGEQNPEGSSDAAQNIIKIIVSTILYVLFAGIIDYVKWQTRFWIVRRLK